MNPERVLREGGGEGSSGVNIWDLEENSGPSSGAAVSAAPVAESPRRRPARAKTRMLGFDAAPEASVVSLFDGLETAPAAVTGPKVSVAMFPVGWLVVKDGLGRGASFPLTQGVTQIGRGADQGVSLDFGDMAISRSNHAAIAYDHASHQFHVGHGGKSNMVRLNGRPLLSTEVMQDGDVVQLGETVLMLKILCTPEFNWSQQAQSGGEDDDMAIA